MMQLKKQKQDDFALDRRAEADDRFVRGLQYVIEGLLAVLLHLVNTGSEEGRSQLSAYGVSTKSVFVALVSVSAPLSETRALKSTNVCMVLVWRASYGTEDHPTVPKTSRNRFQQCTKV